jgi:hypothetical protein
MSLMHRPFLIVLFPAVLLIACAGTGSHSNLRYPIIDPTALKVGSADCEGLDRYLRQVDSIRWSMREDGVELETDFEQVVQLSFATAAAIISGLIRCRRLRSAMRCSNSRPVAT